MTNNSRRRRICFQCKVQLNSSNFKLDAHNRYSDDASMCDFCYDLAGYENEHLDGYHDADAEGPNMTHCLMCNPELLKDRSRKGHAGTAVAQGSHTACYAANAHPKSKEGRAACRKSKKS